MHFPFMDLRRGSKIEVDTNLPWPKSFYINREQRFCVESILGRIYLINIIKGNVVNRKN